APLIIVESHSPVADLLSENTIFFNQIFDDLLLALIHPTRTDPDPCTSRQATTHQSAYVAQNRTQSSFCTLRGRHSRTMNVYLSAAYSLRASIRIGTSGSASFQRAKKFSYAFFARAGSPNFASDRASPT